MINADVRINNKSIQGKYLAEDKSGPNSYKFKQAKTYSDAIKAGKIDAVGVMYFFQNEQAARTAVNSMNRKGLSRGIHVGFYDADESFKWIR